MLILRVATQPKVLYTYRYPLHILSAEGRSLWVPRGLRSHRPSSSSGITAMVGQAMGPGLQQLRSALLTRT